MFILYIILLSTSLACFIFNTRNIPVYIKPLGWLVGFVLVTELAGYYFRANGINNKPLHHLYQLGEMWLICLCYYWYHRSENTKGWLLKTLLVLPLPLTLLYTFVSVYVEGIYNECIINFLINSVLMILLSTHFFYKLYSESTEINVLAFGFFWVNAGNLLYASGTFFQMGLYSYVNSFNPALAEKLNMINHILNYFLYANYLAAFLCKKKYLYS